MRPRYAILGPLRVEAVAPSAAKHRALLAVLLLAYRDDGVSDDAVDRRAVGRGSARRPRARRCRSTSPQLRRALGARTDRHAAVGLRDRSRPGQSRPRALRGARRARGAEPRPRRPRHCCARRWRCSAGRRWPMRRSMGPARGRGRPARRRCGWRALERRIELDLSLGARPRARRRARGADRRAPVPRALPRAADARALPLRPPGRRAGGLPPGARRRWSRSSGSIRAASCSASRRRSSPKTPRSTSTRQSRPRAPRACGTAPPRRSRRRRCSAATRTSRTASALLRRPRRAAAHAHRAGRDRQDAARARARAPRSRPSFADGARFVALGRARRSRRRSAELEQALGHDAARGAARRRQLRAGAGRRAGRGPPAGGRLRSAKIIVTSRAPLRIAGRARARVRRRSPRSRRSRCSCAAPAPSIRAFARADDEPRIAEHLRAARRAPARDRAGRRADQGPRPGRDPRATRAAARPAQRRPARRARRQQTLRGAIGWSYDLLDADAQRLFARARRLRRRVHARGGRSRLRPRCARRHRRARRPQPAHPRRGRASGCSRPCASTRSSTSRGRRADACATATRARSRADRGCRGRPAQRVELPRPGWRGSMPTTTTCAPPYVTPSRAGDADTALRLIDRVWRYWATRGNVSGGPRARRGRAALAGGRPPSCACAPSTAPASWPREQGDFAAAREHFEAAWTRPRASARATGSPARSATWPTSRCTRATTRRPSAATRRRPGSRASSATSARSASRSRTSGSPTRAPGSTPRAIAAARGEPRAGRTRRRPCSPRLTSARSPVSCSTTTRRRALALLHESLTAR